MANCYNDCIHSFVCQYVNHDEYPSVQQLKDDCRYCNIGTDVVPKSEVEELKADLEVWKQDRFNIFQMLDLYKMTRQEVAREIFAEIDEIFVDYKIDRCLEKCGRRLIVSNGEGIEQRFAELKKKYTEEQV